MKPDYDSRINAGLSKEEIAKISGCEDQEMQIKDVAKIIGTNCLMRYMKAAVIDAIDYMICKTKK